MRAINQFYPKILNSRFKGETCAGFIRIVFLFVVFGPILVLVFNVIQKLGTGHWDWLALAFPTGRRLALFARSLGFAISVTAGATIIGLLAGLYFWNQSGKGNKFLCWLALVFIAVPPYVHALTWMSAFNGLEIIFRRFNLPAIALEGWGGALWVQMMALVPVALGMTLLGVETIDPDHLDAARLARPDSANVLKVILPLALPLVIAGAGFIFLLSLTDYSVASLFQNNVYALEIFAEFSSSAESGRAFLLALPLLLVTVSVLIVSQKTVRKAAMKPVRTLPSPDRHFAWPSWMRALLGIGAAFTAIAVLVPLAVLLLSAGSPKALARTVTAAQSEIGFTFAISLLIALISIPLAVACAGRLVRSNRNHRLWWLLVTIPIAVPASLTGIGLVFLWNRPLFGTVYGGALMPILAGLARFAPFVTLAVAAQLRRINPLLLDAARVYQTNLWRYWLKIRLPLLLPGIAGGAGIAFLLSLGELGATLVVAPPGLATLTMRIYNYLHYGASDSVAGLCLIILVSALAGGTGVLIVFRRGFRLVRKG